MTTNFTAKLDTLHETVSLLSTFDSARLAAALGDGRGRLAIAIGSGGSAISAQFLQRCRDTLGLGPTIVQTPMDLVVGLHDLSSCEVWLFSAGADNADVAAAARSARQRRCGTLHVVTRSPNGAVAQFVRDAGGEVHTVPVATEKDGYLATHSLIASIGALLLASDDVAHEARGAAALIEALQARLAEIRNPTTRSMTAERLAFVNLRDTIILAADPQARTVATLLETSIWEACICPIQSTDLRNFAHGRHAWLHHRGDETILFAITSDETRQVWEPLVALVPATIRQISINLGTSGRIANALGVIDGLGVIEALGQALGIDPSKPGYGPFGPPMYEDRSLEALANGLPAPIRHKRAAMARADIGEGGGDALQTVAEERLRVLGEATIGGLVFDYDGTLVATSERFDPPRSEIIEQLVRLGDAGVRIGIATGRGGSAGEDLRAALPARMHRDVVMGYYNGSHLAPLEVDIGISPPPAHPLVAKAAEWLRSREDLFVANDYKAGGQQITINAEKIRQPYRFRRDLLECPVIQSGEVLVTSSGHSFDIVAATATKLRVVVELRDALGSGFEILCFGDSGTTTGNDHALLSHAYGISVGEVCGAPDGCWSLFGDHPAGPDALLIVLRALLPSSGGGVRLDVASLPLDITRRNGT